MKSPKSTSRDNGVQAQIGHEYLTHQTSQVAAKAVVVLRQQIQLLLEQLIEEEADLLLQVWWSSEFCAERNYTILAVSQLASSEQLHIYQEHAAKSRMVVAHDTCRESTV